MCYAIPGIVEDIIGKHATINYFGQRKKAVTELINLTIGDYVYAQGGYVIQKISNSEAQEILSAWKDIFFALQEVDAGTFSLNNDKNRNQQLKRVLDKALTAELSEQDMIYLLELTDDVDCELLFKTANFLRQKYHQNACCVHGIVEISNQCNQSCAYCGISDSNRSLTRYRMDKERILQAAGEAVNEHAFKALVLQSGENTAYSIEELADIVAEIKRRYQILILISFGEIGIKGLRKLYDAGSRGLLMRFETSNPRLYRQLHPESDIETRLEHIRQAYDQGYMIITGGLIGLPGQTAQDIANDILLAGKLNAEMYSFGPFLPHPESGLAKIKPPKKNDVLKVLAISRLTALPESKILVTTAFETLSFDARYLGMLCGANSLMLNVTPLDYRRLFSIYPDRAHEIETIEKQVTEAIALLKSLGRVPTDLGIQNVR